MSENPEKEVSPGEIWKVRVASSDIKRAIYFGVIMIKKLSFPKKSVSIVIRLKRFCVWERQTPFLTEKKPGFFVRKEKGYKNTMKIIDKKNMLDRIGRMGNLELELGCGKSKKHKDAIGIDAIDYECVDIVGDAYDILREFPDHSVSAVFSYHFFEHLEDIEAMMAELTRVMVDGAFLKVVTPHFSNPYFYSDCTHKKHFGLYSFAYFSKDSLFVRKVPNYGNSPDFELCDVKLIFTSPRPFYFRWGIKKILQRIFNLNHWMMEFYEENLCYLFPCYEVRYEMIKRNGT